jgi:tRNA(fMet)-specific endonuclease VapC
MPQPAVLLDTDILSELLKQHPLVLQRVRTYLAEHERLAFSIITRYELLRGLKAKQARTQEAAFTLLCQASLILPLTDQVVDRAATLYGELHRRAPCSPMRIYSLPRRRWKPSAYWSQTTSLTFSAYPI